jgi:predicted metal-dependent peptidase
VTIAPVAATGVTSHSDADSPSAAFAVARLWAAGRFPYLAAALFSFQPVYRNDLALLSADPSWRLFVGDDVFTIWSAREFGASLVHQAHHLLRRHGDRGRALPDSDPWVWQACADAETNDDMHRGGIPQPPGSITPGLLGCPEDRLAEQYFSAVRFSEPTRRRVEERMRPVPVCGSLMGAAPGDGPGEDLDLALTDGEAEALRRRTALAVLEHTGNVPAGLQRWAEEEAGRVVDWREALQAAVRATLSSSRTPADYTYRWPSRRASSCPGVVLPGMRRPKPNLALVVDTSGSISESALGLALTQVRAILGSARSGFGDIWMVTCDAEAQSSIKLRHLGALAQPELGGGGGTDMRAGLAAVAKLRPVVDVTLVLTDGLTPWPAAVGRLRVVVALIGRPSAPVPQPPAWAHVIRIDT